MKRIVIINGHPYKDSIGSAIHEAYTVAARQAGHKVDEILIRELHFNWNLPEGYRHLPEPEPDIQSAQELIQHADHLVWIFPNWWGTYPAMLKGFIDRVFLPGFAFRFQNGGNHQKLLSGKSARIFITMDDPVWYYRYILGAPGYRALKNATLRFCGVAPVRITAIGRVREINDFKLNRILLHAGNLGRAAL